MIRRFELDEGNATTYWEIEARDDMSFTTRWGKVGSLGKNERNYAYDDATAATKASDKLIAERMKSGFAMIGTRTVEKIEVEDVDEDDDEVDEDDDAEEVDDEDEDVDDEEDDDEDDEEEVEDDDEDEDDDDDDDVEDDEDEDDDEDEGDDEDEAPKTTTKAKAKAKAKIANKPDAINTKLELLLADNPDDVGTWHVYADWMIEHGQPWGEVIAIACGGKRPKQQQDELAKQLLGEIDNSSIEWRYGTIEKVSLCPENDADEESTPAAVLARILAHPAGRLVRELELGLPPDDDISWTMDSVLDVIDKAGVLPLLRVLDMTPEAEHMDQESWRRVGDIRCLWRNAPNLRELLVRGSEGSDDDGPPIKMGDVVAPRLEKLVCISSGLNKRVPIALGEATLPELRHLELYLGDSDYGNNGTVKSLRGIFAGKGLPRLEYLGLENYEKGWEVELVEAVATAPIVKRLKTLDLSKGTMWRPGAAAVLANAAAFRHLEKLDLRDNYIEEAQAQAIVQAIPCADVDDQREVDDDDDEDPYRYCSIGE